MRNHHRGRRRAKLLIMSPSIIIMVVVVGSVLLRQYSEYVIIFKTWFVHAAAAMIIIILRGWASGSYMHNQSCAIISFLTNNHSRAATRPNVWKQTNKQTDTIKRPGSRFSVTHAHTQLVPPIYLFALIWTNINAKINFYRVFCQLFHNKKNLFHDCFILWVWFIDSSWASK